MWPFTKPNKKSLSSPLAAAILFEDNISDTGSFQFRTLARDGYLRNTQAYAAINEIADGVAGLPWEVVDPKTLEPKPESRMARLLAKPNDIQQTLKTFIKSQMSYKLIDGNSFVTADGVTVDFEAGGALVGPPGELTVHMPDKVEVKDDNGDITSYVFHDRKGSRGIDIPKERVWHSLIFNPLNQFRGISPLVPSSLDWKSNNESKRWNFSILMRGGRPSGILSVNSQLSKEEKQRFTEELNNKWGGANNAGKIFVLEDTDGGFQWQETSVTPKDADWIKGMEHAEANIAKAYQVPPEIIGDSKNKTYNNYAEARKAFFGETVFRHADTSMDEINVWLPPLTGEVGQAMLWYDKSKVEAVQEDIQKRRQEARDGYVVGLVFPNEYRKISGLENLPDKDNVRVAPLSLAPVDARDNDDGADENDT